MRIKRIFLSILFLLFIAILGILISVPVVNDKTARRLVDELKSVPLPEEAVLPDSVSIVESQEQKEIRVIDIDCSFSYLNDKEDFQNYYIIYTWGSSDYPLSNLDIRGH